MDAGDLRIFEAVARLKGMNRAASELHTVQSNVTARIRLLEQSLGEKLFLRHSRGVTLTAAGQRLLPYADKIAELLAQARCAVAEDGKPKGRLSLGSLETTAMLRLPPVLARFAAAHPAVDLVLTTGTTGELVARVLERRLDGAFVCGPIAQSELAEEVVFREELAVVTAPGLRRWHDALAEPDPKIVVLRLGCSYRQRLEALLMKRGVVGLRYLEFGTLDAIIGCVAAGIGITLLPKSVVETPRRQGRLAVHALAPKDARVDTVFIRRRDAFRSSALAAFLDCAYRNGPRAGVRTSGESRSRSLRRPGGAGRNR